MIIKRKPTKQDIELRKQVEKISAEKAIDSLDSIKALSTVEIQQLLQELQIYQVELEMQNEELRRTQMELDATRARYFDLYDLAPVGYVAVSEKGIILDSNITAATLLGVAKGAMIQKPLSEFILKEDQDIYYVYRKQLLEAGEPHKCNLRMVKKDRAALWVHLEANTARDNDGALIWRIVIFDATERKRIEGEFEKIFTLSDDMICIASINGFFKKLNPAWTKKLGYTEEELLSKPYIEFIHPDEVEKTKAVMKDKLSNGIPVFHFENRYRCKDGNYVSLLWTSNPFVEQGVTYAIARDITELKRAELLLQEREEKLRSIVEHANDFFFVHNTDHEITYISPISEVILGYSPQEMMTNWTNLITDNPINQKGIELTEKAIATGQRQAPYYMELKKKDGKHVMVEINESPIKDSQGNVLGMTGAGRDVTERVRNEQALMDANNKLEDRVNERTSELLQINKKMLREIKERKAVEDSLRTKEIKLKSQTERLEELNIALKILLEHRDKEKIDLRDNILSNIDKLAIPYLDKLDRYITNDRAKTYLDIIKKDLKELVSPFAATLLYRRFNFSPVELQISDFIRNGLSSKEIASQLHISIETVSFHRKNIRKKLGLTNNKANLRSYLMQLSD